MFAIALLIAAAQGVSAKLNLAGSLLGKAQSMLKNKDPTALLENAVSNVLIGTTTTTIAPLQLNAHDMPELVAGAHAAAQRLTDNNDVSKTDTAMETELQASTDSELTAHRRFDEFNVAVIDEPAIAKERAQLDLQGLLQDIVSDGQDALASIRIIQPYKYTAGERAALVSSQQAVNPSAYDTARL